jgi:hypothetical protein
MLEKLANWEGRFASSQKQTDQAREEKNEEHQRAEALSDALATAQAQLATSGGLTEQLEMTTTR